MPGIFGGSMFGTDLSGLGELPAGAVPVAMLAVFRERFPSLPTTAELESKGATHYTTRVTGGTTQEFTFYTTAGERSIGPLSLRHAGAQPAAATVPNHSGSLLPDSSPVEPEATSEPRWLPWVLLGGGVIVAGGIVFAASRRRPVVNVRRRRRTSR
jgi:hypothetical protein